LKAINELDSHNNNIQRESSNIKYDINCEVLF